MLIWEFLARDLRNSRKGEWKHVGPLSGPSVLILSPLLMGSERETMVNSVAIGIPPVDFCITGGQTELPNSSEPPTDVVCNCVS